MTPSHDPIQDTDGSRRPRCDDRQLAAWAMAASALLAFVSAAWILNTQPKANVNTQFALTCALAERGTFAIDAYHLRPEFETSDKALFGGHVYCDKSPVTPILGIPAFLLYRSFTYATGGSFSYDRARQWTTALTIAPAAALLAALLTALLLRGGVAPASAALGAALWFAATPLWGYAVLFYPYLPACALALGGWLLGSGAWRDPWHATPRRLFMGGVLMGLAVFALNTVAIIALVVTVGILIGPNIGGGVGEHGAAACGDGVPPAAWWRRLAPWALGGLTGVSGYFAYTWLLFGSFTSPYSLIADPTYRAAMSRGIFGATRPRFDVAWLLTFHPARGLFFWFPATLLALGGLFWMLWGPARRQAHPDAAARVQRLEAGLIILIFAGFLAYNSAYYMWWGGFAYAPRHLIPALPLLALGLAPWLRRPAMPGGGRWAWRVSATVLVLGALLNAAPVALDPQPHPGIAEADLYRPETIERWLSPMFSQVYLFWVRGVSDTNWGTRLGLPHGPLSLLPLGFFWVATAAWLVVRSRRNRGHR